MARATGPTFVTCVVITGISVLRMIVEAGRLVRLIVDVLLNGMFGVMHRLHNHRL
jgi:hypothetical protein